MRASGAPSASNPRPSSLAVCSRRQLRSGRRRTRVPASRAKSARDSRVTVASHLVCDVGEWERRRTRTSEASSDATRSVPLRPSCVMRAIGISTTSHAKSARVAKKDRFTIASHAFGSSERTLVRSVLPRAHHLCVRRRRQAPTLQRRGGIVARPLVSVDALRAMRSIGTLDCPVSRERLQARAVEA